LHIYLREEAGNHKQTDVF